MPIVFFDEASKKAFGNQEENERLLNKHLGKIYFDAMERLYQMERMITILRKLRDSKRKTP